MSRDEPDLERLVERSLARRAADLGHPTGQISDVLQRVDRRRARRRSVAVAGSIAALGIGALGLAALDNPETDSAISGVADIPPATQPAGPATTVPETMWTCTGRFMNPQGAVFFQHCEQLLSSDPLFQTAVTTTTIPARLHVVVPGDTLASIADRYGITVDELIAWNRLRGVDQVLVADDGLIVERPEFMPDASTNSYPVPTTSAPPTTPTSGPAAAVADRFVGEQDYVIEAGDTLNGIAARHDITLEQLIAYNQLEDGANHLILPGDAILIPPGASRPNP